MRAGALVLERGGPLSHAAILARELGVPAVTNVAAATRRLGGRQVSVDGDRGVVVVGEGVPL
jgi:phosphoenolpyruvate-protein kinase (PTS system EI component)